MNGYIDKKALPDINNKDNALFIVFRGNNIDGDRVPVTVTIDNFSTYEPIKDEITRINRQTEDIRSITEFLRGGE